MDNRRELATRKIGIFQSFARGLCKLGLTPNLVSVLSVVFAGLAAYGFYLLSQDQFAFGWVLAFSGIQLRLLCNMTDGLMAVEGGLKTANGEIYNDFPDRVSDVLIILSVGLVVTNPWGISLGWIASLLAVMTAYIRVLGSSMGNSADFRGPMAKQHRMALLNLTLVLSLIAYFSGYQYQIPFLFESALVLVILGSLLTCLLRLKALNYFLNNK